MLHRIAATAAICALAPFAIIAPASADPDPVNIVDDASNAVPPPPVFDGAIPSADASFLQTPDGWQLKVEGQRETILPVAPLTTALSSREYLVGGTFGGSTEGQGKTTLTGGTLDAGYRIGCGVASDQIDLAGTVAITPSITSAFTPGLNFPSVAGLVRVHLKPGVVNIVSVAKKTFKGRQARVNIAGFRVKIDQCIGQSFIQSYATYSASTTDTEDVSTYLGTVRVL